MTPTTARNIRIPDDLWEAALAKAAREDETVAQAVRRALRKYVEEGAMSETPIEGLVPQCICGRPEPCSVAARMAEHLPESAVRLMGHGSARP